MRDKIVRGWALRPMLLIGVGTGVWLSPDSPSTGWTATRDSRLVTPSSQLPAPSLVRGHLTLLEKDTRQAEDVGQAVIWLAGKTPVSSPAVRAEITTAEKQFSPHVLVVPLGSTVTFPNHDPFNHNVFSLSEEHPFDLGMYGRGETRSVKFERAGIIRIYCNVHPQMSALVVVRDNPWYGQPSSDGSFTIEGVPPGHYVLHAWHERSPDITRDLVVPAEGIANLELELDARGYKFKPHLNKFGRPYPQQGRRY